VELLSNFNTPVMTRTVWHSQDAKDTWESAIQAVNIAWPQVERDLVLSGARGAVLQPLTRLDYLNILPWALKHGLSVKVVRTVARWSGFAHQYMPTTDDNGYLVTVIAQEEEMCAMPEEHLGYPRCCVSFFGENFPRVVDPVWQWASSAPTKNVNNVSTRKVSPAHIFCNPLLRYINVRFAPHIPCAPTCQDSIKLGQEVMKVMPNNVADTVAGLLSGPIEWDCYRGVAVVKTKDFRLVVGSCPTARRYVVNVT
jgi:hypothetical protein